MLPSVVSANPICPNATINYLPSPALPNMSIQLLKLFKWSIFDALIIYQCSFSSIYMHDAVWNSCLKIRSPVARGLHCSLAEHLLWQMSCNDCLELRLCKLPFSLKFLLFDLNFSMFYDTSLITVPQCIICTMYNLYHI